MVDQVECPAELQPFCALVEPESASIEEVHIDTRIQIRQAPQIHEYLQEEETKEVAPPDFEDTDVKIGKRMRKTDLLDELEMPECSPDKDGSTAGAGMQSSGRRLRKRSRVL